MSNSNGQKPGEDKSDDDLLRDLCASVRGFAADYLNARRSVPDKMKSVLDRLSEQFPLMFSGHPGTGVANPPPAAPPSVDPIPSEWDAAFNGSIPSANDPKTPPDWHLTPSEPAPAAPVAAPFPRVFNVDSSNEEWAIIEAHRAKKQAALAKIAEQQGKEDLCNSTVIKFLELAIELYKECYVPYAEDRKQMFLTNEKREEVFRVLLDKHWPQFKTEAAVYTALDIAETIIENILDNVSGGSKERYHWNLS